MRTKDNKHYYADEGCFIVRKSDNFVMGENIDLGSADSIDNYKDEPYTEKSYKAFYDSLNMEVPKKYNYEEEEKEEEQS